MTDEDRPSVEGESIPSSVQSDDELLDKPDRFEEVEWVLPNGAEVEVEGRDATCVADRVEFMSNDMVVLYYKSSYEFDVYPLDRVQSMRGHTNHVEEEEWW